MCLDRRKRRLSQKQGTAKIIIVYLNGNFRKNVLRCGQNLIDTLKLSHWTVSLVDVHAGTLLASATVIAYVMWPSSGVCVFRSVGFHLSVNLLYSPLLVKTTRTYRIFAAAKSSVRMPPFVSGPSQIMFVAALLVIQVETSLL